MLQILVIDDDPAIQILLKRTLIRQGYEVAVASDGKEGLAKAQQFRPDLIICDWLMPRLNGLEVCQQVKAMPELATTFFILLTSRKSLEDRIEGLDAGADDFLGKPIEMSELQARVRSGLRLSQLSRDLQEQKQLLETELAEAAEYVCSILPKPITKAPTTIDARFIPSRQLGGDSYDYYWLDSEHLVIYLLDVSGHGLRAALPSLSVLNLLRSRGLSKVNYYQPREVLLGLNRTFKMSEHNDHYFTIWYGVYNQKKHRLVYASAGHPPAVLFSPDRKLGILEQRLKTPGFPIGMFADAEYSNGYCQIDVPATLYLFSDGIYEIAQADGTIWGIENFVKLLKESYYQNQNNLNRILKEVKNCNLNENFDDDLSIIHIDFN